MLDSEINRAINTSKDTSSSRSNQWNLNHVPLVVTDYPNLPRLERTIRHYHHILLDSNQLQQAILFLPIIAFCRPRRVHGLLISTARSPNTSDPLETFAVKLEGARPAPYGLPPTSLPAVSLVNALG